MQKKENLKNTSKSSRGSAITSVISITLVLFLLGMVGFLVLNAQMLSNYVRENLGFSVILKEDQKEIDIIKIQKILDSKPYVKSTEYITRERAAQELKDELGEDFIEFLGYNPLPVSIDVKLYAAYANNDSIAVIEQDLQQFQQVKEVIYQKNLVKAINDNIKAISTFLLIFTGLLGLISVALINNTIRLSIYSNRFIIYTMQVVGATRGFIRKPFVFKGILQGVYAALIAILMFTVMLYFIQRNTVTLFNFIDPQVLIILFSGILAAGVFITWLSTTFAVNKYLDIKFDKLFS